MPKSLRPDASYLIIGGFGGVGRQLTRWAARAGAGHLVLLGRSNLEPSSSIGDRGRFVEEIRALGVGVTVVAGDVASMETMERVFGLFGKECPELRGVFQAATAQSVADLSELSEKQVTEMLRPKVLGTWMLHEWTKPRKLDFLISFSSTASLWGSRGMAHYAAANQFMDNFAYCRRAQGLPMLSVNWGAWYEVQGTSAKARSLLRQMGLLPMDSATALGWMPQLIGSSRSNIVIADVDWTTLKAIYEARRIRPMLADVGNNQEISNSATDDTPLISSMAREERAKFVEQSIISASAKVLGFRADEVPPVDIPLTELGLDSLMAVDLRNRLQAAFGCELPPTIVFDYPTISGLVEVMETMMWAASNGGNRDSLLLRDEIHL
jgi:myxalamid-type polyketide synthase MxaE and MxaD